MKNTSDNAKRIFMAAIELTEPSDWSEFVNRESEGNAELEARVHQLLAAHHEMGSIVVCDPSPTQADESMEA